MEFSFQFAFQQKLVLLFTVKFSYHLKNNWRKYWLTLKREKEIVWHSWWCLYLLIHSSLWCGWMGYLYEKAPSPILEWMCVGIFLRYVVILWEESILFLCQAWAPFITIPGSQFTCTKQNFCVFYWSCVSTFIRK